MTDSTIATTEFYLRFNSDKIGTGIHEFCSRSLHETAKQFIDDNDSVSAMKMDFNAAGQLVAATDITPDILSAVSDLLAEDIDRCTEIKKRTSASHEPKTEFYIRCHNGQYGISIHESPCYSLSEALGRFVDDEDSVSVLKLTMNSLGRLTAASDFTGDVLFDLKTGIDDGEYETCPHPVVQDEFDAWQQNHNRIAEEQAEHERIESALLHV